MKRVKQQQTVKSTIKKARSNESVKEKHPLQVYCRVRPLQNENESSCVNIEPPNSLLLTVTDANRAALQRQMRFVFKHVFDETTTQEQVFKETSLPLVQNLICGRNGLLRDAYGDMMRGGPASTEKLSVNEENVYSVFITYIEIYNNSVYDLLEDYQSDDCTRVRAPQPKIIREDGSKNMYVHGVDEIEVSTPEEAVEIFYRGQKRRRLAHTASHTESSRSGAERQKLLSISQLSLVDLAGSERTSRSKTAGARLREAGNINNSLMTLRSCFELLRENQQNGTSK
ncbi:hypothetical protein LSTR_LSTR005258 [Laodelphax striatellus]|uniref:Kinesin-like protein n=1 Tax=Laodelphax striatellus TaxID=195883 RepID=A0A482X7Y5_LAOST|nr:hypothetical protein LSTR_LSTR005258 [Laodelphax striatellus]